MASSKETAAGIFMLIGIVCVAYLTIKLGRLEVFVSNGYPATAVFSSVTGLRSGADVEIAGVRVGKVLSIHLDTENASAVVEMKIDKGIVLTDDVMASVKTSGLIGDKYISLELGAGDPLEVGDVIVDTESSIDIEALISKYVFGDV